MCGECNCYDVDPSGDWGDIHGDTCECDERNCHATYDRYTDDFCSGQHAFENTHTQFDILLIWTTDFMESLKAAFEFHCKFRRLCRLNKQDMC